MFTSAGQGLDKDTKCWSNWPVSLENMDRRSCGSGPFFRLIERGGGNLGRGGKLKERKGGTGPVTFQDLTLERT